jgi:hypothetical protein
MSQRGRGDNTSTIVNELPGVLGQDRSIEPSGLTRVEILTAASSL